jgi:predicted N-acyltransferase
VKVHVARTLAAVDAAEWNALPGTEAPFLRHEFLHALEATGCATAATGWDGLHVLLRVRDGRLAAALRLYL